MARCQCNQLCNCFVVDDGFSGDNITNNNSSYVEGIGLSNAPYELHNIHDPGFIPPAAKITYNGATFNTDFPGGSGGGYIPRFDGATFNTVGMFNANQPDRLTVLHHGIYFVGFDVSYQLQFSGASSSFEYSAYIEHRSLGSTYEVLKHQYFETTTIWPLTVRQTQQRLVPVVCEPGDYFKLVVAWALKPIGIPYAAMWACYS